MTTWRSVERFSLISQVADTLPATNRSSCVGIPLCGWPGEEEHPRAQSQKAPVLQLLCWRWVVWADLNPQEHQAVSDGRERVQVPPFHLRNTAKAMKVWTGPRPTKMSSVRRKERPSECGGCMVTIPQNTKVKTDQINGLLCLDGLKIGLLSFLFSSLMLDHWINESGLHSLLVWLDVNVGGES